MKKQEYENYEVIFIDDASTDQSAQNINSDHPNFTLIQNKKNLGRLSNNYQALKNHCDPSDIAVFLEGDDWFAHEKVLSEVNEFYNQYDCWLSYGHGMRINGELGRAEPICSKKELFLSRLNANYAYFSMCTFRAGLFHKLLEQDPEVSYLKNNQGNWCRLRGDLALMVPLVELAGFEKIRFNSKVSFISTQRSDLSDEIIQAEEQDEIGKEILRKKACTPLVRTTGLEEWKRGV